MRTSEFTGTKQQLFGMRTTAIVSIIVGAALSACGGGAEDTTETASAQGSESRAQAYAAPVQTAAVAPIEWGKVGDDGDTFHMYGSRMVRYGAGTQWVKKKLTGTAVCEKATFGSDPAPGITKTCESKEPPLAPAVATLTWNASTDSDVTGYRVYFGSSAKSYLQAPGTGIMAGRQTSFAVAGLPADSTYYFAVTAIDSSGKESSFSNEAAKRIQ